MQRRHIAGALVGSAAVLLGIAFLVGLLPGTSPYEVRRAKTAVRSLMKDPYSSRFSDVVFARGKAVCGNVNAKNDAGAYTGGTGFAVVDGKAHLNTAFDPARFYADLTTAFNLESIEIANTAHQRARTWCDYQKAASACPDAQRGLGAKIAKACYDFDSSWDRTVYNIATLHNPIR